jgi:hypothetical protein
MPSHFRGPLLASGARNRLFENLHIEAVDGESDLVTAFDDFNESIAVDSFGGTNFETNGWALTDVGAPVADTVTLNAVAASATGPHDSCLRLNAGTAADTGGNMQLQQVGTVFDFPHLKIPCSVVGATILDNTEFVFACRIGLLSNAATWDGKLFIGMAEEGDTGILTAATGAITQAETGPLVGFHVGENGRVDGISQRTVNTAYAAGTNRTELYAAAAPDGNSSVIWWVDLAFRMQITDMSDNAANGRTTFYHRRVRGASTGALAPWIQHPTVLSNQTPNNDLSLTPTIELVTGPTNLSDLLVDWWAFGATRFSRR